MTWALLHFWNRILRTLISSTDLLPFLLPPPLTSILNPDSLPLATRDRAVSAPLLYSLSHRENEGSLGFSSRNKVKSIQEEPIPLSSIPPSSIRPFFDKMVLLHISEGVSLNNKWKWFNLYFRGSDYSGFEDIFSKKLRQGEKNLKSGSRWICQGGKQEWWGSKEAAWLRRGTGGWGGVGSEEIALVPLIFCL